MYTISDDKAVLDFYYAHKDDSAAELAESVCKNTDFWGEDLSLIPGFAEETAAVLEMIEKEGTLSVMNKCLS